MNSPNHQPRPQPPQRRRQAIESTEKRPIISDAIYTTDEAAALCCVEPSTIRAAVRSGILRGKGRPYRFRGIELFKLV
jgi:hypothetical protein